MGTPDAVLAINTPNVIADSVPQIFAKKTTIPIDHFRDNLVLVWIKLTKESKYFDTITDNPNRKGRRKLLKT